MASKIVLSRFRTLAGKSSNVSSLNQSQKRYLSRERLSDSDRDGALASPALNGWSLENLRIKNRDAIRKTFQFSDFNEAFAFMTKSAVEAERLDHHPEWFNVYNRVEVTLSTHTCSAVTALDIELAKKMNEFECNE